VAFYPQVAGEGAQFRLPARTWIGVADVQIKRAVRVGFKRVLCGRFTQAYSWQEILDFLNVFGPPQNLRAHYNIAPTMDADVITAQGGSIC